MENYIEIIGAKSHNLKDITCRIPRGKITVITGVSGSGKSTLAFDTLFAEGQRRYIESLSTYAGQFLEKMDRPDVEAIHGIPPAIAIEQKNTVKNARSTVGTASEIYDYLRLLYAKIGEVFCPQCHIKVSGETVESVVEQILGEALGKKLLILNVHWIECGLIDGVSWIHGLGYQPHLALYEDPVLLRRKMDKYGAQFSQVDAAYPGSGNGQPCAWNHPFQALPPGGPPRRWRTR